jgi:hypothetical protein
MIEVVKGIMATKKVAVKMNCQIVKAHSYQKYVVRTSRGATFGVSADTEHKAGDFVTVKGYEITGKGTPFVPPKIINV